MMGAAQPTLDERRASSLDVAAFQDVAIHGLTKPATVAELRERLSSFYWFGPSTDWRAAHREYVAHFEREAADPDTRNWKEQRDRRMARQHAPKDGRRKRA